MQEISLIVVLSKDNSSSSQNVEVEVMDTSIDSHKVSSLGNQGAETPNPHPILNE